VSIARASGAGGTLSQAFKEVTELAEQKVQSSKSGASSLSLVSTPAKYIGFALVLAWHYCLWFVPQVFHHIGLLEDGVTFTWLANLAATVLALFCIAKFIGRRRHLSNYRWLYFASPLVASVATLLLLVHPASFSSLGVALSLSIVLGAAGAVMWILWGEHYASVKAGFSIKHIGTVFGLTLITTILISTLLPALLASLFVMLLPLASGILLLLAIGFKKKNKASYPCLLPKKTARAGLRSLVVVSVICFVASAACYFLAAIIPWELLPHREASFTYGIIGGALLMLIISAACILVFKKMNVFKLLPWLLVVEVVAFTLFLVGEEFYYPSFLLALAVCAIFEIFLIMYFGILTSKGYVPPAWGFCFSCGFIRAGIVVGNSLAVSYEQNPVLAQIATPETCLIFIGLLTALLIPLVKQQFSIVSLTSDPVEANELQTICQEVTKEFSLSKRESEILVLLASGHRAESIAKKLVISPYTVNTHIRHIYEKTQINKRSDLLNYINMQRSDY